MRNPALRCRIPAFIIAVLLILVAPLAALDSVEDALCVCADDVLGTGDFVSCVAEMSRRLVANGTIGQPERSGLVSGAAATDIAALQQFCEDRSTGSGPLEGFGTLYAVGNPFCPGASPSGPTCLVLGKLKLWNFSKANAVLVANQMGQPYGCLFQVRVLNAADQVVRREDPAPCLAALEDIDMPIGTLLEYDADVPMVALNSDPAAGVIEGEKLPNGIYQIVVEWSLSGPENMLGTGNFEGRFPEVTVPVRVGGS